MQADVAQDILCRQFFKTLPGFQVTNVPLDITGGASENYKILSEMGVMIHC